MRRLFSVATVVAGAAALLAVPVVGRPVAQAHAVAPHVYRVTVPAGATGRGVLAQASRLHMAFDLVGATWAAGTLDAGSTAVEVRVQQAGGWSQWTELGAEDGGADGGTPDAHRAATVHRGVQTAAPTWVGPSTGVEARVVGVAPASRPGAVPSGLQLVLVDGGTSPADAHPEPVPVLGGSVADAAVNRPTIYTRADWGADESIRQRACPAGPDYAPTVKMGFIHHTDNSNGYTRAQVPGIIRSIYAYHVESNGWCDVGYNFLVDRFGRIWEGRYGGITKAVVGAHAGGFNYESFGVALIGTYNSVTPSTAMMNAVEQLFAWKLSKAYRDPLGKTVMTAASFSGSRWSTGDDVTFDTVSGHRDADYTDCPGSAAYALLPNVRTAVAAAMGAGFAGPAVSAPTAVMADGSIGVTAKVVGSQSWTLTVKNAAGTEVAALTGTATRTHKVATAWDLTDSTGAPVPPGVYTLRLTGADSAGDTAVPWTTTVEVTPPVSLSVPRHASLGASVTPRGTGIPGHQVSVSVAGPGGPQPVGTFAVGTDGAWKASSTVAVSTDLSWSAADPAVTSYVSQRTTRVAPTVTAPTAATSFVPAGTALPLHGTALPGSGATVTLETLPAGSTTATAGSPVPVNSDGSWSTSFVPTVPTAYWVTDTRRLASHHLFVYPVSSIGAHAPAQGYAGRSVRITGNAGGAPVPVTLSARQPGAAWATVRTVTARTGGHYAFRLPLADAAGSATRWKVATGYATPVTGSVQIQPVFAPTVTGPARSSWNAIHLLSGTAVPVDTVTVWTASPGRTTWVAQGTTKAGQDSSWSFPITVTKDVSWRVTSPSGTSSSGTTVVVPTLHAPGQVAAGSATVLHGRAIPGQSLTVDRRLAGTSTWTALTTVTVGGDGTWSLTRHPRRTADYRVISHGQHSRTVTVSVV